MVPHLAHELKLSTFRIFWSIWEDELIHVPVEPHNSATLRYSGLAQKIGTEFTAISNETQILTHYYLEWMLWILNWSRKRVKRSLETMTPPLSIARRRTSLNWKPIFVNIYYVERIYLWHNLEMGTYASSRNPTRDFSETNTTSQRDCNSFRISKHIDSSSISWIMIVILDFGNIFWTSSTHICNSAPSCISSFPLNFMSPSPVSAWFSKL